MSFSFFGITFYAYGLIVGLATAVELFLAEYQAKKQRFDLTLFWRLTWTGLVGGIVGARLYHVLTAWSLYQHDIFLIPQIWQGGLSIIGAVVGGAVSIWAALLLSKRTELLPAAADIAALALPVGQAIGRVGNYVNQELYGIPTSLPWKIYIDLEHRIAPYLSSPYFHPLFAYEALGMLIFAAVAWWIERHGHWQVGSGNFALFYVSWYGLFRGSLEFLRIDKTFLLNTQLGVNQVVLLLFGATALLFLLQKLGVLTYRMRHPGVLAALLMIGMVCVSGCQVQQQGLNVRDRSRVSVQFIRALQSEPLKLTVEVVNTDESRTLGLSGRSSIGSDGMLFVFPTASQQRFWMKDMKMNLDMIWIDQGKVIDVTHDVPAPTASENTPQRLKTYSPAVPASLVLEVPAGSAKTWQLQVGDTFELP